MPSRFRETASDAEPALPSLVKNVVDGLGTLVAGHVKLARVELEASAKTYVRHVGLFAIAGALVFVGYAFACAAGGFALAHVVGTPVAFLLIGGAHLLGAGIAVGVLLRRVTPSPLGESLSELDRTVSLLSSDAREARRAIQAPATRAGGPERLSSRGIA